MAATEGGWETPDIRRLPILPILPIPRILTIRRKNAISLILSPFCFRLRPMAKQLIINADDFGFCRGINRAVAQAHNRGILTSATLMAGAGAAEEAVEIARQTPTLGVGVHLNLLDGRPVSRPDGIGTLLNARGEFALSVSKLALTSLLSKRLRNAVETELAAQIEWVLARRIKPTHLDSHKHIHAFATIWPIVCRLARRFDIPAVRWPWEPPWTANAPPATDKSDRKRARTVRNMAKVCRCIDATFIKNQCLFGLVHTGRIDGEFWSVLVGKMPPGPAEVMTHPGYAEGLDATKTRLIAQRLVELEAMCSDRTKKLIKDAGIELTHYGKL